MSSMQEFLAKYWTLPEYEVAELPTGRCKRCSKITYASFRADSVMDEWFRPRTIVLGDFRYVANSAFAGCHVCRIIMIHIVQTFTHITQMITCYTIIKQIGLKLSLDDELTLHCWDGEGHRVQLSDLAVAGVIELEDHQPDKQDDMAEGDQDLENMRGGLLWHMDEASRTIRLLERADNRLILNPSIDIQPLLLHHWLDNCKTNHSLCRTRASEAAPDLPTRILDVGILGSHQTHLFISNGLQAPYMTLSHCWGATHHTMALSNANFDSFVAGVDDSEMPRTFREAIMLTRNLGQRYLWIDSMCILQPTTSDKDDWSREGARMGEYYSKSILNLAASAAMDNTERLLHARAGSQFDVKPFPLFDKAVHREWDEFSKLMGRNPKWLPIMQPKAASWLQHVQGSPLSSRAWVLQERLLATRTLHCTVQGFFWECSELRASEYEPLGCSPDYSMRDHGLLSVNQFSQRDNNFIVGAYWRHIIESFSQLRISFPSDRLPALAGLARTIQEHTEDTYIAGHFKTSLISSLLWFRLDLGGQEPSLQNSGAPSWSWASTSGGVKFTPLEKQDYPTRDPKEYQWRAALIDISAEPEGISPHSWVLRSSLKLQGYLTRTKPASNSPKLVLKNRTVQEQWSGHVPMPNEDSVVQLGVVHVSRKSVLEDLEKPEKDEEPDVPCSPRSIDQKFKVLRIDDLETSESDERGQLSSPDEAPVRQSAVASDPQDDEVTEPDSQQIVHRQICDGCDKILGIRHRCLDCPDFDYCSTCIASASLNHPNHDFEQLSDPRSQTASIVANHDLLHATIKRQMEAARSSQEWKDIEESHQSKMNSPEPVDIILDHPDEAISEDQLALFLVMSGCNERFHEGLVLIRSDDGYRWRRVGFFSSKLGCLFDDIEQVEVELI